MAIVGGTDDEDLNNPNLPGAGGNSSGGGGYAGDGGGQGATTKAGGASPAATSSGNYSNLSSYLQANQGAGGTTGKAAENVVDQAGNAATGAIGAYGTAGSKEIDDASAKLGPDAGVMGQIKAGGDAKTGTYTGPDASTTDVSYGGPTGLDALSGTTKGLRQTAADANATVQDDAVAAGNYAGVSGLLRQAYQQPSYSQGENNLDTFLANGTPDGQAALGQAKGVAIAADAAGKAADTGITDRISKAGATAKETNRQYSEARDNALWGAQESKYASDQVKKAADAAAAKKVQDDLYNTYSTPAGQAAIAAKTQSQIAANPGLYNNIGGQGYGYTGQGSGVNMDHILDPLYPTPAPPPAPLSKQVASNSKIQTHHGKAAFGGEVQPYSTLMEKLRKGK